MPLASQDQKQLSFILINGFTFGFPIGYKGPPLSHRPSNLKSAYDHPDVITTYLTAKCTAGHTAGPYSTPPFPIFNTNPLDAVPKKNSKKWCLIMYLSHPPNSSVNDGIPVEEFSLKYISVDTYTATDAIMELGQGCLLTKIDVKSTFRICLVRVEDQPLLGIQWQGAFYYDKVLPFGLHSAPYIFNCLAEVLCWILQVNYNIRYIMHYLDDFFTLGAPNTIECSQNLNMIMQLFAALNTYP